MARRFLTALFLLAVATLVLSATNATAAIVVCDIHNGMTIWFLDYAQDDSTLSHPLGVLKGTVEINERTWQSKCKADGPNAKIYVPFSYRKDGAPLEDTRWPQDVYRTRSEAERAYHAAL